MRKSLIAAAAGAALALAVGSASAAPRVVLTLKVIQDATFTGLKGGAAVAGTNIITCDSSLGAAANAAAGCVASNFSFSSGPFGTGWTANNVAMGTDFGFFNTSFAGNAPGTPTLANLDATQNLLRNLTGATGYFEVDLQAFDYNLPAPGGAGERYLSGSASLTQGVLAAGESVESFFYADGTNSGLQSNGITCTMLGGFSNNCNAGQTMWIDANSGTFSMRDTIRYTVGAGNTINTTSSGVVTPVPEPMSVALVGVALLGAAAASRRRKA